MKRNFCVFFALFLLAGLLAACAGPQAEASQPPAHGADATPFETVNALPGVELRIEENSLSATGLELEVYNGSDETLTFSSSFFLEKLLEGVWFPVSYLPSEHEYAFSTEAYEIPPGESHTFETDWGRMYGEITPGRYRLIKDAHTGEGPDGLRDWYFTAEFGI